MRINKMITKEKMLRSVIKLSQLLLLEMYEDLYGEFICGYWGLKGLKHLKDELTGQQPCCNTTGNRVSNIIAFSRLSDSRDDA